MATDAKVQADTAQEMTQQRSAIEKFFDSFLQESNIKWLLMIGMAIVTGCSLMLVTQKWGGWPVTLKYVTILGYTIATYAIAELCQRRLGLRATSEVLRLLTIALIPIGFLALSAMTSDSSGIQLGDSLYTLLMMVPATAFMGYAADRIFQHWFHGRQRTFLAAYTLLCLFGALPVINQTWLAILFSCGFWLVMTLGVLKVNRHTFWLTEEHRWPRIYGFTPILILGTQLIVLYIAKAFGAVPFHWLGFGVVMLAATILMTTRTIASVFRQRTGDLVHPLPMSLIWPLLVGLLLIAAGVLLSFHGFHFVGQSTVAVIPTSLIATALLMLVAKDTRHQGFVWIGLVLITIGYQSLPILFSDLVMTFKSSAAAAIQEERLPIAFYGLTYLPLLLTLAVASRLLSNRGWDEFSFPMKRFTNCVSLLLLVLALGNIKAAFVVSSLSVFAFVFYAILFRERACLIGTMASLVIGASTMVPFINAMQWLDLDWRAVLVPLAALGFVWSATNRWDAIMRKLPSAFDKFSMDPSEPAPQRCWVQDIGRAMAIAVSCAWIMVYFVAAFVTGVDFSNTVQWIAFTFVVASLARWAIESRHYGCGLWFWSYVVIGCWFWLFATSLAMPTIFAWICVASGIVGIVLFAVLQAKKVDISLQRHQQLLVEGQLPHSNRFVALLLPLAGIATIQFIAFACMFYVPTLLWATIALDTAIATTAWWAVMGLTVTAAIVFRGPLVTLGAALFAPVAAGVLVGECLPSIFTYENLPLVYAIASAVTIAVLNRRVSSCDRWLVHACSLWLYGLVWLGFVMLAPLTLAGAAISLLTIFAIQRREQRCKMNTPLAIVASGLAIVSLAMIAGYQGFTFLLPISPLAFSALAWMSLGLVAAIVFFDQSWTWIDVELARLWSILLRLLAVVAFTITFFAPGLSPLLEIAVIASLVIGALNEFRNAVRDQREDSVYVGFCVIGAVVLWIQMHHQLPISPMMLRIGLVVIAAITLSLAKLWDGHLRMGILVRSLRYFGLFVPMIVAATSLALSNHNAAETLAVFGSAMILFVHGMVHRLRRYVAAAAAISNLGMFSLLNAGAIRDPQFYLVPLGLTVIGLVELLKRDIPGRAHEPLRYAGALVILVSPCLEILGGSWLHMLSLMVLSVLVIVLAIGLRLRALVFTGTAFLLVDLVAMVVRSSIDNPGILWIAGLAVGAGVIAFAAVCERNREQLLSRIRVLSAELSTWH